MVALFRSEGVFKTFCFSLALILKNGTGCCCIVGVIFVLFLASKNKDKRCLQTRVLQNKGASISRIMTFVLYFSSVIKFLVHLTIKNQQNVFGVFVKFHSQEVCAWWHLVAMFSRCTQNPVSNVHQCRNLYFVRFLVLLLSFFAILFSGAK